MASVSDAQFVEELIGMHAAECRGEALFSRIAANTTDPVIRREMEELVWLEQAMQRHLGRLSPE